MGKLAVGGSGGVEEKRVGKMGEKNMQTSLERCVRVFFRLLFARFTFTHTYTYSNLYV